MTKKLPSILLSTDTLKGYGLDHIFDIAKTVGCDGIDLAIRKNYDARNTDYVLKLTKQHKLPVHTIQVSAQTNAKEMEQAFALCDTLWASTITINAPKTLDFNTFRFLTTNLRHYKHQKLPYHFAIINPQDNNLFALPIPKYRFNNLAEIIKKYHTNLALDIANMDEDLFDNQLLQKLKNFLPHIATIYFADKTQKAHHIIPGDGTLKCKKLLSLLAEYNYDKSLSIKLAINNKHLADTEKVILILTKAINYIREHYHN